MTENPTQSAPPQGPSFLDDTFARLRSSGYERDTDARWFGGVCSGLAQRLGVDPVLVRAAAVVLAFVGGIGLTNIRSRLNHHFGELGRLYLDRQATGFSAQVTLPFRI